MTDAEWWEAQWWADGTSPPPPDELRELRRGHDEADAVETEGKALSEERAKREGFRVRLPGGGVGYLIMPPEGNG